MRKYLVEFIGTFFLVFTVGSTIIAPGAGRLAPLAIGGAMMVLVYAGGPVSGGHYNPAITLASWMRGKTGSIDVLPYWLMQVAAAFVAAWLVHFIKAGSPPLALPIGWKAALLAEFLFTFALCWVYLQTATAKGTANNQYFGLAIGGTLMVGTFAVGSVSGAAFNPAVATGLTLMGLSVWNNYWILVVGEVVGAMAAATAFRLINANE